MRRCIFILPLLTVVGFLNAQIANNWTFGYHAGLNFATTPPSVFTDSINARKCNQLNEISAVASNSISDCNGTLLFYTNGLVVWNKNHQLMPNYCLNDSMNVLNWDELKTKILKLLHRKMDNV